MDQIRQAMFHGNLNEAQTVVEEANQRFANLSPEWVWKFRLVQAEILDSRGLSQDVISLLKPQLPPEFARSELAIEKFALLGPPYARLGRYEDAWNSIHEAEDLCKTSACELTGEIARSRGIIELKQGLLNKAESSFRESLQAARAKNDKFLEAKMLLNLAVVMMKQERFDQSIDWSSAARDAFRALGSAVDEEKILGNLGWAYYKMGDFDKSLDLYQQAAAQATKLQILTDQVRWANNLGLVYFDKGRFTEAEKQYQTSLDLSNKLQDNEQIFNGAVFLSFVALRTQKLELAKKYSEDASNRAQSQGDVSAYLYPLLAQGQIAVQSKDSQRAKVILQRVAKEATEDKSLQWQAHNDLAELYESEHQVQEADKHYTSALKILECARNSLRHEEFKLPFLANAANVYDDYLRFLIAHGNSDKALREADYSRAQTLSEGLGVLKQNTNCNATPEADVNPQLAARKAGGTILFYWLGQQESYLWVVTDKRTTLIKLPPAADIDALVKRYREALVGPRDVLQTANADGSKLYDILVAPARAFIPANARVTIIPDGSLNNLNFETLLVTKPTAHYWIEDVTLTNASSMRMLAASTATLSSQRKLLLIGNPVVSDPKFPPLPNAVVEMQNIEKHFAQEKLQVSSGNAATPLSFLNSKPEQFTYIHFVAHGTASEVSPLDSAVILSKTTNDEDSYKLHARDIMHHRLRADLVVLSSCYGSGTAFYNGEGLVGLSWAFVRAGAHNVIGALWAVSDTSTPKLMDRLYEELGKGRNPQDALRAAKLSLLHSDGTFRKPVYWAPFQLYTGS